MSNSIEFDVLLIRVSELQTTRVVVAPWETPVLRAMYGEDVEDEFARLALKYGPKNSETPIVAAVYGNFGPGVAKLRNAINRVYGVDGSVIESGVAEDEVPELTEEQIDAISAAGDAAQAVVAPTEIIEPVEPQPPIEGGIAAQIETELEESDIDDELADLA